MQRRLGIDRQHWRGYAPGRRDNGHRCFGASVGRLLWCCDVDGGWGISPDDERAHGLDERLPVRAMYDDVLHWEMIFKALAS